MVADRIPTKPFGARPPLNPPPPVAFDPNPGDRDRDMLTYLIDNVHRLLRRMQDELTPENLDVFKHLLRQRKEWVKEEMTQERLFSMATSAPLGLDEDPYSLQMLTIEFTDKRLIQYRALLDLIEDVSERLDQQIPDQNEEPRAS